MKITGQQPTVLQDVKGGHRRDFEQAQLREGGLQPESSVRAASWYSVRTWSPVQLIHCSARAYFGSCIGLMRSPLKGLQRPVRGKPKGKNTKVDKWLFTRYLQPFLTASPRKNNALIAI